MEESSNNKSSSSSVVVLEPHEQDHGHEPDHEQDHGHEPDHDHDHHGHHDHDHCDDDHTTSTDLTVEEVIEKHVGSFGISQIIHVLLVSIAWIFNSQNTLVTIFSDAQPTAWKCKSAINGSSSCNNFTSVYNMNDIGAVCGLKDGTWEWVGGHKSTIIAEWNLVCHRKFLAAIPASLFFLGSLLGTLLFPFSFFFFYT